jgi:DNA-binding NtrC family response regulator
MSTPPTILLVDDEAGFRENVAECLQKAGFRTVEAGDAEAALARVREIFVDVALVDVLMPGMDGITLLGRLKEIDPRLEVIVATGQGSIESAVEAMRRGAYHYVTKPVRLRELGLVVRRASEKAALARQNDLFREDRRRAGGRREAGLVAASAALRRVIGEAERVAPTEGHVLIEGETGAGKELVAELIHRRSPRHGQPFVVLNCGALAENLLDAELFGHEKGAFTGAAEARPGLFEVADGGTLLLDEIGDVPPAVQVRLLRVLERGLVRRVGATRERAVDVRVLAATHRRLEREVAEGRFREDLFHRLNVFRIAIPPLRERPDDVLPLAEATLARLAGPGGAPRALGEAAQAALRAHRWPGNARELVHAIERACHAAAADGAAEIRPEHLGLPAAADPRGDLLPLREAQDRHVRLVLDRVGGNRQKAAAILGVTERHLYRLLQRGMETVSEPV